MSVLDTNITNSKDKKTYRIGITVLLTAILLFVVSTAFAGAAAAQESDLQGDNIAVSDKNDEVKLIDTETDTVEWTYEGHSDTVTDVQYIKDLDIVVSASWDNEVHAINADDGTQKWTYTQHAGSIQFTTYAPNMSAILSGDDDGELHAINADDGTQKWTYTGHTSSVLDSDYSPENHRVYTASADNSVHALNPDTQSQEWSYTGHAGSVQAVEYADDLNQILSGDNNNEMHVIDADGTQNWTYSNHTNWVSDITYADDIHKIITGSDTVDIIDPDTQTADTNISSIDPLATDISYVDGVIYVASSGGQTLKGYNTSDGSEIYNHTSSSLNYPQSVDAVQITPKFDLTVNVDDEYGAAQNVDISLNQDVTTISDSETFSLPKSPTNYTVEVTDTEYEFTSKEADLSSSGDTITFSLTSESIDRVEIDLNGTSDTYKVDSVLPESFASDVVPNGNMTDANPDLAFETNMTYTITGDLDNYEVIGENDTVLLSQNETGTFESDSNVSWTDNGDTVEFTVTQELKDNMTAYRSANDVTNKTGTIVSTSDGSEWDNIALPSGDILDNGGNIVVIIAILLGGWIVIGRMFDR